MHTSSMYLRAITISILMTPAIAIADDGKIVGESVAPPVVVRKLEKNAPSPVSFENGKAYAVCSLDSNGWPLSKYCSALKYEGITYWPMSFKNNRYAILVVGYDDGGKIIKTIYACGTRYIWSITIDSMRKNVIFWGQESGAPSHKPTTANVPWGVFHNDGANVNLCN